MSCDVGEMSRAHSPSFPSLHLCPSSFPNTSLALPTSQLILQPFFRVSYGTGYLLTSPDEPPMEIWIVRMKIKLVVTPQWNKPSLSLSQKWRRGSTNAVNIIIESEGKHIFSLSLSLLKILSQVVPSQTVRALNDLSTLSFETTLRCQSHHHA